MATVVLVRHGRTHANSGGILAGRAPGVLLDEVGQAQATDAGQRLAVLPLAAVVSSPLERCRQTAEAVAAAQNGPSQVVDEVRLTECGYGDWTGRELKHLAKEPLWKVVQGHPSAAAFPGGESLRQMQARALDAVRDWDHRITDEHGDGAVWLAVSHGDVIKSILADALGTHLDNFQRIVVDPASISAITYTALRPFVVRYNEHGDVGGLVPPKRKRRRRKSSDAAVGGGAGS
ncbi:MAG: MSMEG_4193 family putative phosphomutase [Nocardioidaceae bacterium]|nr:MSMEG_4193 family putative phosphomutase [Nocardioidaceae bacterium]